MSETTTGDVAAATDRAPRTRGLGRDYRLLFTASTVSNLGDGIAMVAYPWLASAVTRNPLLIAFVAVVQRVPWLVFTLPAGVITDRHDRQRLMVLMNGARAVLTLLVALVVLGRSGSLPGPDALSDPATAITTDVGLYLVVIVATLLLGMAEVLYDNTAQTFMPAIVPTDDLEKANGRLWGAEQVANAFAGPPLGAVLVAVAFSMPFFVDAATFAVSAALITLIARPAPAHRPVADRRPWREEAREGFDWLWHHDLLRPLAITLGLLNALGMMSYGIFVLFAQEVLDTTATEFAVLMTGGAVGGVIGGWAASAISRRLGPGPSLIVTLLGGGAVSVVTGLMNRWPLVWLLTAVFMLLAVLWNVITVSLRQAIIPDHLLGRVNSVYRFFGWGMMPIGTLLGGLVVVVADTAVSREMALRMPFFVAGLLHVALLAFAAPRLTTARIEAAREAAGA